MESSEEGDDQQQWAGKRAKLLPPTADGVENSSPDDVKSKHDGEGGGESGPAKKRRLTSDSLMVGPLHT